MSEVFGIIIGAFVYLGIGMFWYSPTLFGKAWCEAKGFVHEDMKNKKMPKDALLKAIINALVISTIFTVAAVLLQVESIEGYLRLAFIAGLLGTTNEFSKYIWEQEKLSLVVLNSLYLIVAYVAVVSVVFYV